MRESLKQPTVSISCHPQYTSVDNSSVSSLAPSSGSYTSSQPTPSALHSTHNSSNSSSNSISHLANMSGMGNNMSSTVAGITGSGGLHSSANPVTTALGLGSNGATATSNLSAPRTTPLLSSSTGKRAHVQYVSSQGGSIDVWFWFKCFFFPSCGRTLYGCNNGCVFVLTGKAPPNLSQGVPPLLPNQYIMGPGGLLPAYPVSRLGTS